MRKHLPVVLLVVIFAALVFDIGLHTRTVHAQNPLTVYIDSVPHHFRERHDTIMLKGAEVIGFQCANGSCYALGK